MSAMPENIVPFQLPKKPKVRQKDAPPDQRKLAVVPLKAATDTKLTDGAVRVLIVLCSYCNRAGITWVSQARLAQDLGVSRQAVTNQLAQLRNAGYVEIVKKGFRGERSNTLRVVFDSTVDTETAIAVTSAQEDNRPPAIKQEQAMQDDKPDPEGQRRIAQLVAKALKPTVTKKEYTMPKGKPTRTVQEMQDSIAKAKQKKASKADSIGHSTVSNEDSSKVSNEGLHRQSIGHSGVSQNTENTVLDKVIYKDNVLRNQSRIELREAGLSDDEIDGNLEILLAAYQAEGLTPNPDRLATEIADLAKVGRGIA